MFKTGNRSKAFNERAVKANASNENKSNGIRCQPISRIIEKIVSFDFRTEYIGLEVSGFQLDCRCLYIYGNSSSMKKIHETVRSEKHVVDVAISIVDETNFNLAHIFLWKFVIPSIRNFIKKYFLSLR